LKLKKSDESLSSCLLVTGISSSSETVMCLVKDSVTVNEKWFFEGAELGIGVGTIDGDE
jgi:hypothetical protein